MPRWPGVTVRRGRRLTLSTHRVSLFAAAAVRIHVHVHDACSCTCVYSTCPCGTHPLHGENFDYIKDFSQSHPLLVLENYKRTAYDFIKSSNTFKYMSRTTTAQFLARRSKTPSHQKPDPDGDVIIAVQVSTIRVTAALGTNKRCYCHRLAPASSDRTERAQHR